MDERPILVAFDLSEGSVEALRLAIEIARSATAPLHLVSVIKSLPVPIGGTHGMDQYRPEQDREEYLRRIAAENWDLTVAFSVVSGPTVEAILGVAEKVQPRYLILGRRSRSKLARLFSSSTSEELSQRCWFPVLSAGCPPDYSPTPAQPRVERPESLHVPPALWQRLPSEAQSIVASEWEAIEGWVLQLEDRLRASEARVPTAAPVAARGGGVPVPGNLGASAELWEQVPAALQELIAARCQDLEKAMRSSLVATPATAKLAVPADKASAPEPAPSAPEPGEPAVEPSAPEADEAGQDTETGSDESDDRTPQDRPTENLTSPKKRKKRR